MWDDRIDETARELTRGEPGGDFRAHVVARIQELPARAGVDWKWVLAPATAALVVAIAIVAYRVDRSIPAPAQDTRVTTAEEPGSRQAPSERPPVEGSVPSERQRVEATPDPEPSRNALVTGDGLEEIAPGPLALAEIEFNTLEQPDLYIQPLSVAPIEMSSIDEVSALEGSQAQELR